jgi:hypothetical protein
MLATPWQLLQPSNDARAHDTRAEAVDYCPPLHRLRVVRYPNRRYRHLTYFTPLQWQKQEQFNQANAGLFLKTQSYFKVQSLIPIAKGH